jgi:membrane-associated protease RseP (regulator of RpoE activity)
VIDMLKTLLLVLAGSAAGLGVAFWLQSTAPSSLDDQGASAAAVARPGVDGGASAARLAALEDAFAAEVAQRAALEERVAELAAQLEALGERSAAPARGPGELAAGGPDPAVVEPARARFRGNGGASREDAERRAVEQFIAAGFAPDRAEWINRRTQELRMASLQAQYDATREGRPFEPGAALAGDRTLRTELGDADYERYLTALDRPTSVGVRDVLASSPAETSGLRAGDQIVAYDGQRVFDMRELNTLTLEGTPGESVVVGVLRDGQNVQLVMPRGPIGILGGGFRGR